MGDRHAPAPQALTLRIATVGVAYDAPLDPGEQTLLRMPDQVTGLSLRTESGAAGDCAAEVIFQEITRFEAMGRIVAKRDGAIPVSLIGKSAFEAIIAPYTPARANPYVEWIRDYDTPSDAEPDADGRSRA